MSRRDPTRPINATCERCRRAVEFEVVVTPDVWRKIGPHGDESGYLCFWCMDAACVAKGLKRVPAIIYCLGESLSACDVVEHVEIEREFHDMDRAELWSIKTQRASSAAARRLARRKSK